MNPIRFFLSSIVLLSLGCRGESPRDHAHPSEHTAVDLGRFEGVRFARDGTFRACMSIRSVVDDSSEDLVFSSGGPAYDDRLDDGICQLSGTLADVDGNEATYSLNGKDWLVVRFDSENDLVRVARMKASAPRGYCVRDAPEHYVFAKPGDKSANACRLD